MLRLIRNDEMHLINDDPVRPHIGHDWRIRSGRQIFVLENDETKKIDAVICCAYMDEVPKQETDMKWPGVDIAVFYTVWSYSKGSGREIIFEAQKYIRKKNPYIKRYVTLSPLTDMAEKFHLRNGASLIGRYNTCQNFEYPA
jgi:hypothetical protein